MLEEDKELRIAARRERLELTQRQIEQGVYSIAEAEVDRILFRRAFLAQHPPSERKVYINADEASIAYERILDSNCSVDEALLYVEQLLQREQGWGKRVRHSNYLFARKVVGRFDNHLVQRAMKNNKTFDRKRLTSANTVSKQLSALSRMRGVHESILNLQKENSDLKEMLRGMCSEKPLTDAERAIRMYLSGLKTKQIAESLGVTDRTVRRWVNGNTANLERNIRL